MINTACFGIGDSQRTGEDLDESGYVQVGMPFGCRTDCPGECVLHILAGEPVGMQFFEKRADHLRMNRSHLRRVLRVQLGDGLGELSGGLRSCGVHGIVGRCSYRAHCRWPFGIDHHVPILAAPTDRMHTCNRRSY